MYTIDRAAYEGDIVSRLRNWRGLHLAHSGELFDEAAGEIERLRLTPAERAGIQESVDEFSSWGSLVANQIAENLRRLLERTK